MSEFGYLVPEAPLKPITFTPDELARLRGDFERKCTGRPKLPLPPRTRVRLWLSGRIDSIGIWLVEHEHIGAARKLWRI